jgi:hypothetical protein
MSEMCAGLFRGKVDNLFDAWTRKFGMLSTFFNAWNQKLGRLSTLAQYPNLTAIPVSP